MWLILIIIITTISIVLIQVPSLIKRGLIREVLAFSVLLSFGMTYGLLYAFGVELMTPLEILTYLYKPITDFILYILK